MLFITSSLSSWPLKIIKTGIDRGRTYVDLHQQIYSLPLLTAQPQSQISMVYNSRLHILVSATGLSWV